MLKQTHKHALTDTVCLCFRTLQRDFKSSLMRLLKGNLNNSFMIECVCHAPVGNGTTRRPPDHRKETQTAVVWTCLPFIMSDRTKTILQSRVKGGRRQGRQKKKWEDNISEWTGLEFAKSQRAVEDKEKWRKLVVQLSVVPQRPLWLRDR